jgi:hypothetical protein
MNVTARSISGSVSGVASTPGQKDPPGGSARRVALPRRLKDCLVPVLMATVMSVSMPMSATVPATMSVAGSTVVIRTPPVIDWLPTAVIANDHALAADPGTAVAAAGVRSTGVAAAVTSLSGNRSHNGKAGSEGENGEECFHGVGLVGCCSRTLAAALTDGAFAFLFRMESLFPESPLPQIR